MNGKGDKRRPGKPGAYEEGYESIDWGQDRTHPLKKSAVNIVKDWKPYEGQHITSMTGMQYTSFGKIP